MKILIVGGSGLIGSYLAPHLIEQGHEVIIVDARQALVNIPGNTAKRLDWNITSDQSAMDTFDFAKPDAVIFMASTVPDGPSSVLNPSLTMKTFQTLAATYYAAQASGVKRFIYLSSVPRSIRFHEPLSMLHELVERFIHLASTDSSMDAMILKATNVYAPGTVDKRNHFLNDLLKASATGEKMRISPHDRADFVYIGDAVAAITGAVEQGSASVRANLKHSKTTDSVFYISSGNPTMNLVEIAETYNKAARELGFRPARYDLAGGVSNLDMAYEESDTSALILLTGISDDPLELELGCHKLIEMERLLSY
jgi:nucleoside-diphosphate-sugar epimerase